MLKNKKSRIRKYINDKFLNISCMFRMRTEVKKESVEDNDDEEEEKGDDDDKDDDMQW